MELMLDTNIVLDHVCRREPFYELSRRVCLLGITKEANTYISATMITDLFYILKKDYGGVKAQQMIADNLSFLQVVGISPSDVSDALLRRWSDFEDCLVARCARNVRADYIITRNTADFKQSMVPAITPDALFTQFEQQGITYLETVC